MDLVCIVGVVDDYRADRVIQAKQITVLADINAETSAGNTILHYAALRGNEHIKFLLDHKANANAKNKKGETPLDLAKRANASLEIVELLRQHTGQK